MLFLFQRPIDFWGDGCALGESWNKQYIFQYYWIYRVPNSLWFILEIRSQVNKIQSFIIMVYSGMQSAPEPKITQGLFWVHS